MLAQMILIRTFDMYLNETEIMTIEKQILSQLGGSQFLSMTGEKNLRPSSKSNQLSMRLTRNKLKANYLIITLTDSGKYVMQFYAIKQEKFSKLKQIGDIYCESLRQVFESETGLKTSLQ